MSTCLFGQIELLEYELFDNRKSVRFEFEEKRIRCDSQYVDWNQLKNTLRDTVNHALVIELLHSLMWTRNEKLLNKLYDIYLKYAEHYNANWGYIYLNHCLGEAGQLVAIEQFRILSAFEITLRSLSMSKMNSSEIWQVFKNEHDLNQRLSGGVDKLQVISEYERYSDTYKELNAKAWFASGVHYHYLEPYVEMVKDSIIAELDKCECPLESSKCNIPFLRYSQSVINLIHDKQVTSAFLKNEACLSDNAIYFWLPINYIAKNYNAELLETMLDVLYDQEPERHISYKLSLIFDNVDNFEDFEQQTITKILEGRLLAVRFSQNLPTKEIKKALNRAKRKYKNEHELIGQIQESLRYVKLKLKYDS